jgi:hypothetical protein
VAVTAGEVMLDSAGLLNDPSQTSYTNAVLLPFMKMAYREYAVEKHRSGDQLLKEISTALDVPALAVVCSNQPSDLITPISLEERADGSTGLYNNMTKTSWEPDESQNTTLGVWNWREEQIKFRGATTAREVRIRYWKLLTDVTSTSSVIVGVNARVPLQYKVAALAAGTIGGNDELATIMGNLSREWMNKIISVNVKSRQDLPVRRRRFQRRR